MKKSDESDKKLIKLAVPTVLFVLVFFGGLTALCMFSPIAGFAVMFFVFGGGFAIAMYSTRRGKTLEKYIAGQNGRVRDVLWEIYERVTEISPDIKASLGYYPVYSYFREGYMLRPVIVLITQPRIFSTKIRVNDRVIKASDIDFDLITEEVTESINIIKERFGIDREDNNTPKA